MRRIPILLSVFVLTFVSCSESSGDLASENTNVVEVDERFQPCYYADNLAQNKCDTVLRDFFGSEIFKQHIRFDKSESFINCQRADNIEMKAFGDTNCCLPNTYDMVYTLRENGQKIYEFHMVSGSDMEFEHISTQSEAQLLGYKKLLGGDFKIDYSEAVKIAKANGVNFQDATLELVTNETKSREKSGYHWEAELEYDHNSVVLLWIDVMTGRTSKEVMSISAIE